MNKLYNQDDAERDQNAKLDKESNDDRRSRQNQAAETPYRQQGGFNPDSQKQGADGSVPAAERDRDYDPDGERIGRQP